MEAFYSHFKGAGIIYRSTIELACKTFLDRWVTGEAEGKLADHDARGKVLKARMPVGAVPGSVYFLRGCSRRGFR